MEAIMAQRIAFIRLQQVLSMELEVARRAQLQAMATRQEKEKPAIRE